MTALLFFLAFFFPTAALTAVGLLGLYTPHWLLAGAKYLVCLLVAALMWAAGGCAATHDTEYWTGLCTKVGYRESYTETVVETYTDGKGHVHTRTRTVYHGPEYYVWDTAGQRVVVNEAHYLALAKRFGTPDPPREGVFPGGGRRHEFAWPGDDRTAEVVTTAHGYENRTQLDNSVWKYPEVGQAEVARLGLFPRPILKGFYHADPVLGDAGPTAEAGRRLVGLVNGKLGPAHQVHVWVLVFKNRPVEAAVQQEAYWKGGKKNELVLCFGVDDAHAVTWARAFSWSDSESLKAEAQTVIAPGRPLDLARVARWLEAEIPGRWKRKEFKEFKYIAVRTPGWAVAAGAVLMLAACAGLAVADAKGVGRELVG